MENDAINPLGTRPCRNINCLCKYLINHYFAVLSQKFSITKKKQEQRKKGEKN